MDEEDKQILPAPNSEEKGEKKKKDKLGKTELTLDRAILAQERTLSAWVRTGASFITFGFAIYKLLHEKMTESGRAPLLGFLGAREIGIIMLLTGFIGVILGLIRYYTWIARLKKYTDRRHIPVSLFQAYVIIALSLLLLYGALTRN